MAEWTHTKHHGHILITTYFQKMTEIPLAVPVKFALYLFKMIPEHITGHKREAAFLHLPDFLFPLLGRHSGKVDLSHRWDNPFPVKHQPKAVPSHFRTKGDLTMVLG